MQLNKEQQEAVNHVDGPCLVTANPGSGKTAIIVERVVKLLRSGVQSKNVLVLTFTNKAGKEVRERIQKKLNLKDPRFFIGTFHSLCAKILRKIGHLGGYNNKFSILDGRDQTDKILQVARYNEHDIKIGDAYRIGNVLNFYRDQMEDFSWVENALHNDIFLDIAEQYIEQCKKSNMIDFSGLISECVRIIEENENIKNQIQNTFKYVLIDETQDTNVLQFYLINLLGEKFRNIMIVGDFNQSIYRFRGARYQNIQDFVDNNSDCKIIKLPKNYRSTPEIINTATKLIKYNDNNEDIEMITDNKSGEAVKCYSFGDQIKESEWVAGMIKKLIEVGGWQPRDFCVSYRVNKMSESIETALVKKNIPYFVVGSYNFYDRKESRDCLAMLKLLANNKDTVSFHRTMSLLSGVGNVSIGKIEKRAEQDNISLIDACSLIKEESKSTSIKKACQKMYDVYKRKWDFTNPAKCLTDIVEEFDYNNYLHMKYGGGAAERIDNITQIADAAGQFEDKENGLYEYLQNISLITNNDKEEKEEEMGKVSLMSIHSVKGLEFNVVFVLGVEQSILPHQLAIIEDALEGLQEERRLCYVAISRAKKILYITYCRNRKKFGSFGKMGYKATKPSQFLKEAGLIEDK